MQKNIENTEIKKTDLRVIKTKNSIKSVFKELCKEKHLDKITVTEIAKEAIINKGTFYLHYRDIYALFDETIIEYIHEQYKSVNFFEYFFISPHEFTAKFLLKIKENFEQLKIDFPYFNPKQARVSVPSIIGNSIKEQIYATNKVNQSLENDILLEYMFSGLLHTSFRHSEKNFEKIVDILAEQIEHVSKKLA